MPAADCVDISMPASLVSIIFVHIGKRNVVIEAREIIELFKSIYGIVGSIDLKCSEPLLKDLRREQQITQLQNSMAETQKQILALQASRPASVTGKATTVDVTSIAPRKR